MVYKFSIITSEKRFFISLTEGPGCNYSYDISKWLFDEETPKPTYKKGWYEISSWPKTIKKYHAGTSSCIGFRLNPGYAGLD